MYRVIFTNVCFSLSGHRSIMFTYCVILHDLLNVLNEGFAFYTLHTSYTDVTQICTDDYTNPSLQDSLHTEPIGLLSCQHNTHSAYRPPVLLSLVSADHMTSHLSAVFLRSSTVAWALSLSWSRSMFCRLVS